MIRKLLRKILRAHHSSAHAGEIIGLDVGLTTLEQGEDTKSQWDEIMLQRRKEMKQFMQLGAIAASDERAELMRALKYARRAIDACAPYAETTEAMSAPEFREEINRLMVRIAEIVKRRPDFHESVWDVVGCSQPYLRANSSEDHEGA